MTEDIQTQQQNIEELLISHKYTLEPDANGKDIRAILKVGRIKPNSEVEIYYDTSMNFFDQLSAYMREALELRQLLDENQIPYTEIPLRKDYVKQLRDQAAKYSGLADLVEGSKSGGGRQ